MQRRDGASGRRVTVTAVAVRLVGAVQSHAAAPEDTRSAARGYNGGRLTAGTASPAGRSSHTRLRTVGGLRGIRALPARVLRLAGRAGSAGRPAPGFRRCEVDQARSPKDVFNDALELPAGERGAFLDRVCAGNEGLRRKVEDLLAIFEDAPRFMAAPTASAGGGEAASAGAGAAVSEGPGSIIGRYKLLQLIGEGGFGSVFMAQQESPVQRRVALKIIKLGMDTRQVIARFEAERQALALMEHPNIARVFDAGATEAGRPYFVMELVRGEPLTDYCDRNQLSIDERLRLFAQVCQAVQHAHQKGVIHRDLKPSNVLVTSTDGQAIPKVIDFGIAKATSARLTEKTVFTEHRQLIGTPEYMSPEQAEMTSSDIDTRSDVYSLGVLLYELLTGALPFDARRLRSAAFAEIQRIIREEEPPTPSLRLSRLDALPSVAARRQIDPARLLRRVRGDLDWIVMKCLDKDRTRRYGTADALAQ
ncbi:MAG: serine/threonine protein kinase, partial [Phycisphaerae bacterium]|nr:serine/threonine protein kinase [Phycisphaerae bacterium]